MHGQGIAARALAEIGTPFRLRGRTSGVALDCVGLVLVALGPLADPSIGQIGYTLKGDYRDLIADCLAAPEFRPMKATEHHVDGDIILVSPAPSQLHLLVAAGGAFVHAHAGVRCVVHSSLTPDWRLLDRWRAVGD